MANKIVQIWLYLAKTHDENHFPYANRSRVTSFPRRSSLSLRKLLQGAKIKCYISSLGKVLWFDMHDFEVYYSDDYRVLKCWRHKNLNLWNYGICRDIQEGQLTSIGSAWLKVAFWGKLSLDISPVILWSLQLQICVNLTLLLMSRMRANLTGGDTRA